MAIRLLYADKDIIAQAVTMLRFPDCEIDRLALVIRVANHPTIMVNYVPAIAHFIEVHVESCVRASLAC